MVEDLEQKIECTLRECPVVPQWKRDHIGMKLGCTSSGYHDVLQDDELLDEEHGSADFRTTGRNFVSQSCSASRVFYATTRSTKQADELGNEVALPGQVNLEPVEIMVESSCPERV